MTVKQLIEELQRHDSEIEVQFAYNYGDHWRTCVSERIAFVSEAEVEHSEYHQMDRLVDSEVKCNPTRDTREVLILTRFNPY